MKDTNNKLLNKQGRLTPYAFACGYIEQFEYKGIQITLWKENGAWHLRKHNFNTGKRIFWDCPSTLSNGRKMFDFAKKQMEKL